MSWLKSFAFVFASALAVLAQQRQLDERQLGAYKGRDEAVASIMSYCNALDHTLQEQPPRIFAQLSPDSSAQTQDNVWQEFTTPDDWQSDGRPTPLAFVWSKNDFIVRVIIISSLPLPRTPPVAHQRIDYCYGSDTKLKRIRSAWYVPTECEVLFPCRLISGREFTIGGQRPAITDWVFTPDDAIHKLHNGKQVEDYFDPSNSLSASQLHLKTSADLPFFSTH
jgi:hypothetical protein